MKNDIKIKIPLKLIEDLADSISWDNWKQTKENSTKEYMLIGEVIYNKLNYILQETPNLEEEHVNTLKDIITYICPILNELDEQIFDVEEETDEEKEARLREEYESEKEDYLRDSKL